MPLRRSVVQSPPTRTSQPRSTRPSPRTSGPSTLRRRQSRSRTRSSIRTSMASPRRPPPIRRPKSPSSTGHRRGLMAASATTAVPPDIEPAGRRLEPVPQGEEDLQGPVPRRAEGVQLLGELPGSGYRQAPALARRDDGQLIKLTPLLYQLVDAIDGRRAYDQLARELSQRSGRQASANDVRYLVENKLQPLGVLQRADGTQPVVKRSNPLLTLRPRVIVSKPKWTR